ncbi:flavin monoamine oxidase family protein [Robiginitalea marina]|uniref:FAD-dependent oxidoreductase n=1 Tax=Robiginitalea marina TaxID=2954105 RepID=A0ABT1AWG7_9FLAO|nr:FAD-dependent oxidoreductase [Robiginitalea marina]MCO5723920.1 FAD-dependent oxidoreductase [Robiginitalea marina]
MVQTDVLIIGGGLTGLTLQHLLRNLPLKVVLVEGRKRLGGRILTHREPGGAPIEMGATWLGSQHTRLGSLLEGLGLETFPQKLGEKAFYEWISTSPPQLVDLPPNNAPSYRIRGGTDSLIAALAAALDPATRFLGERVETIRSLPAGLRVTGTGRTLEAQMVVSTLPPYLFLQTIQVFPKLPADLAGVMEKTHTWMGESIKFGLSCPAPFWDEPTSSGTVFSNVGPVSEMYDHSRYEGDAFALKGFLDGSYASLGYGERKAMVLKQLKKYYGARTDDFTAYFETVWAREPLTYAPYSTAVLPHQNNGHPLFREPCLGGRLVLAGSETAPEFPGYMEGAVASAGSAFNRVREFLMP